MTREEIERIVREEMSRTPPVRRAIAFIRAIAACERVAAAVREEERALVCALCGEPFDGHACTTARGYEAITRAEYAVKHGGRDA